VISGKVIGPPKISQDGSALVVKTRLANGTTVQETFPTRRIRGKQKQLKQLVPAEDVLRTIEEATELVADAVRNESQKEVRAVQEVANQLSAKQKLRVDTLEHNFHETNRLLRDTQCKAGRQTKRAVPAAVAARSQTKKAREQARQAMSFVEALTAHVNA
jgi:hypothetical protein